MERITKRTRLKMAIVLCAFLMGVTCYALHKDANEVAASALAGLMIIGPTYIIGDSYRKSDISNADA